MNTTTPCSRSLPQELHEKGLRVSSANFPSPRKKPPFFVSHPQIAKNIISLVTSQNDSHSEDSSL